MRPRTCKTKLADWRDRAGRKGQEICDRRKRKVLGTQKSNAPKGEKGKKTLDVCAPSISLKHTNSMERKRETTQNR